MPIIGIDIGSAGCASGEEPYTLKILCDLARAMNQNASGR